MKQGLSAHPPTSAPTPADDRVYWRQRLLEVEREYVLDRTSDDREAGYESGAIPSVEIAPGFLVAVIDDPERSGDALRDALSTRLMELFRLTQARSCFGLLFELNSGHLLVQVAHRLRRYQSRADPHDLLQEVFFNIYRYPRNFDCRRNDAFRVWTATIVRNTVLKHLRSLSRSGRAEVPFEDLSEHPEEDSIGPLKGAIERESHDECKRVYLTYLYLYLQFFKGLSEREQRALQLVEVENASYRQAAAELGIKLENLKMVIFRARRKIFRAMRRVFEGLPPDMRAARDRTSDATEAARNPRPRANEAATPATERN